ncbi:YdcF family protein [Marinilactibacillus sp. GCM10026970]|uniref:YdcF family protein n=1 Tax=Marinilactibacillus sp. GCM10026970 TaxID=3252642 RepID=UPI00360B82A8
MVHLITVFFIALFIIAYIQDRRKVLNGFFLTLALISVMGSLAYETVQNPGTFITYIFVFLFGLIVILLAFGGFGLIIFSFFNTIKIYQKEGIRLKNSLLLVIGIGILFLNIARILNLDQYIPTQLDFLFSFASFCLAYVGFFLFMFAVSSLLYQIYYPKLDKDYIIILGSGLIDGYKVPPLLQSRIKKGLNFYRKQLEKNNKKAYVIFSGGQGKDERLPEAEAMAKFAKTLGLEEEQIILESQSKNTYENMKFSAEKMTSSNKKAVFVTNNYHLLRAGIYAKRANIDADGIGARTAFYYIPNAFIREFIAFMNLYRKYHLIILSIGFVLNIILTALYLYLN